MAAGFPVSSWVLRALGCAVELSPLHTDGLPGSTLGLKWDPSHCGPLGVCVDRTAPSAPRRGPTSAHAHLARLAREGQRGQRSQDSQGIHTSWSCSPPSWQTPRANVWACLSAGRPIRLRSCCWGLTYSIKPRINLPPTSPLNGSTSLSHTEGGVYRRPAVPATPALFVCAG
ncbi:unnamed protein product [Gadus morhua 'NCC']